MSAETPTAEEKLHTDIDQLKDPERYNDVSLDIADTQQAIDIISRLRHFVAADQGGMAAWTKLKHAADSLEKDLEAKLSEGNEEDEDTISQHQDPLDNENPQIEDFSSR